MVFSARRAPGRARSAGRPAVVHIAESFGGGVAAAIHDYVRNLPDAEHHLLYCPRVDAPLAPSDLEGFAGVTALPSGFRQRLKAIRRDVELIDPEVVHAHSSFGGAYARLALRSSASRPIVYTPHCYSFERGDLSASRRTAYWFIERVLSFNTAVYAGCSSREVRLSHWRGSAAAAELLPNVPPHDLPARRAPRSSDGPLRVVAAGRFGPQKDPAFFAAAIQQLKDDGREVDAVWIGGGDGPYADLLVAAGVRITGWLGREGALRELAEADVYVHVAKWEGFPIALLESDALGIPTVVRDIPAFEDVDVPLRIAEPRELSQLWDQLLDASFRTDLVRRLDAVLAGYVDERQQDALRRVYGIAALSREGEAA
ncbi:glycosyltransferase [Rathayibacter festucae]|uniref:D-inositol 3-phosphate glycosyltransferase n=1 Tax=Rathayibacter festucae TaxID=110937 RepID=A0ABX6H0U4_9MICO|nr:glycosyltransferase [Rathayibacter festucae]QHC63413.1 glycosyltransferase [Rathayibacter festucae]